MHANLPLALPPATKDAVLSVMLNRPNKSPMLGSWPLAAACCQAMGVAAAAAKLHPLVAADRLRPQLDSGITPGSPAEKQRIAILLERRAVAAMVGMLPMKGAALRLRAKIVSRSSSPSKRF